MNIHFASGLQTGGVAVIPISGRGINSTLFMWSKGTLDDCRALLGVLGESHMYLVYYICFCHTVAIIDVQGIWEVTPSRWEQLKFKTESF